MAPGLIDPHVHLRDPGQTEKEDIRTGTAAAAAGGFTAIACMPNTKPVVDTPELVQYVLERAETVGSGVRVLPIAAVTAGQKGEKLNDFAALKAAGAAALSDDGVPIMSASLMREALKQASACGMTILCHEEDKEMVQNYAVNEGEISKQLGIPGRPAIAEELMVMRDGMLALETGVPLHFCHISTAGSVEIIRQLKAHGAPVTAETCPQYFTPTQDAILEKGSLARVNPPLRTQADVDAILAGLQDGTLDCIATDHAPHTAAEKAKGLTEAPSGMVGPGDRVGADADQAVPRRLSDAGGNRCQNERESGQGFEAGLVWHHPWRTGRSGALQLDETWTICPEKFHSKGRNTPSAGWKCGGELLIPSLTARSFTGEMRIERMGTTMSFDKLQDRILTLKNPTVAGLDARLDYVPEHIRAEKIAQYGQNRKAAAEAIYTFNCGLMDALCDIVPAVKPQSAYYENLGWEGMEMLERTIRYAKEKGFYVIADIKRGDIGSTATAYAEGWLGKTVVGDVTLPGFDADCVTVNGYMGSDAVKPFLTVAEEEDKSLFVLVRTSNPSAVDLQDQEINGRKVYTVMGDLVEQWGAESRSAKYGFSRVGAVTGATYPEDLRKLRQQMPHTFFLVPGYGAQGGTAEDVANAFHAGGKGAIINSSRGIMCAWKKTSQNGLDYQEAARRRRWLCGRTFALTPPSVIKKGSKCPFKNSVKFER